MVTAVESVRCKTVVDNEIIEQVMDIISLGTLITSCGQLEKEVTLQVLKTNRTAGCTNDH